MKEFMFKRFRKFITTLLCVLMLSTTLQCNVIIADDNDLENTTPIAEEILPTEEHEQENETIEEEQPQIIIEEENNIEEEIIEEELVEEKFSMSLSSPVMLGSIAWVEVHNRDDIPNALNNGNNVYCKMMEDISKSFSSQITIPSGKTLTIDMNGNKIQPNMSGYAFNVKGTLILINSNTSKASYFHRFNNTSGGENYGASGRSDLDSLIIVNDGGTLTVKPNDGASIIFDNNITSSRGGAIYINNGIFNMYAGTTIKSCTANDSSLGGGAVYISSNGTFNMYGGTIDSCTAKNKGGAVFIAESGGNAGKFYMSGGVIQKCSATENGGGVYVPDKANAVFEMTGGTISNCSAKNGGAIYANGGTSQGGTVKITNGTISGNTAVTSGGGLYVSSSATLSVSGATISNNTAIDGGGVFNKGTFTFTNGTISGNTATYSGGGVRNDEGTFNMSGVSLKKTNPHIAILDI